MIDKEFDLETALSVGNQRFPVPLILPSDDDVDIEAGLEQLPDTLPLLALRDSIVFPRIIIPVVIKREMSKQIISYLENVPNRHILVATQNDPDVEVPTQEDLVPVCVVAEVLRVIQINDDVLTVLILGKKRARLETVTQEHPFMRAHYSLLEDEFPDERDVEYKELAKSLQENMVKVLTMRGDAPMPFVESLGEMQNPTTLINFCANNFTEDIQSKLTLFFTSNMKQRGYLAHKQLSIILEQEEIRQRIIRKTRNEMDQQQKEYFLQQQLRSIKKELNGDEEDESNDLLQRAKEKNWDDEMYAFFKKELHKLERTSSNSPDYGVQLQFLETLLELPWKEYTKDNFDIKKAEKVLNRDHFGMEKVKERILEHLSVLKLKGNLHAPILCLYGPPGVGKTSLGRSIAEALGRKYVRISLGGLHDESEIRGHRRTYIGAMPGRIIKGILKGGSSNPVFVLDEIDKLGRDYKGDPASALLEVLDPEQNNTFHDNYLDVEYDLSQALFIATANSLSDIPYALRDRLELIEVPGYILEEKVEIAYNHLLPKELSYVGLKKGDIRISRLTLSELIQSYTRESGVRELSKQISALIRKVVRKAAVSRGDDDIEGYFPETIQKDSLEEYLGTKKYHRNKIKENKYPGVVTGLAWTSVGGEILLVESAVSPSKAGKMSITGNLGEVMKESAILALEYIKSHSDKYGINAEIFNHWNVHIHIPEGAIPKDGPSAGITLVTSLLSTFTQRLVRPDLAMTGEVTLRGKVLPVGGIREKVLAAKRSGVTTIVLSRENERDVKEINPAYIRDVNFVYVDDVSEVIKVALLPKQVDDSLDLTLPIIKQEMEKMNLK